MNRRPRVSWLRVAGGLLLVPTWALVAFVAINSFGRYSTTGDATVLVLIMGFAAWAWWYGEDRDRRRAQREDASSTGQPRSDGR